MKSVNLNLKQAASMACSITDQSLLPEEFDEHLLDQVKSLNGQDFSISNELKKEIPFLKNGNFYGPSAIRLVHANVLPGRARYLLGARSPNVLPPLLVSHYKKGGTGKTTVLVNVAIAMAMQGIRVLFIDADPQGSSTTLFGLDVEDTNLRTLQHVLFGHPSNAGRPVHPKDAIVKLYDNAVLDLIPSDLELSSFDRVAYPRNNRERLFEKLLREHVSFFSQYDIIVCDTSPSPSLMTLNLMLPATHIMMPVSLDVPSMKSMRLMLADREELLDLGASEKDWMIVANVFQPSMNHSKESLKALRNDLGQQMMKTVVPSYAGVSRQGWAHENGRTLIEREPSALASKKIAVLANELLERIVWQPIGQGVVNHEMSEGSTTSASESSIDRVDSLAIA